MDLDGGVVYHLFTHASMPIMGFGCTAIAWEVVARFLGAAYAVQQAGVLQAIGCLLDFVSTPEQQFSVPFALLHPTCAGIPHSACEFWL